MKSEVEKRALANGVILAIALTLHYGEYQIAEWIIRDCGITKSDLDHCDPNDRETIMKFAKEKKIKLRK